MSASIQDRAFKEFKEGGKKWFMKGEVTADDTGNKPFEDKVKISTRHVGISRVGRKMSTEEIETYLAEVIKNKAYSNPVKKVKLDVLPKQEIEISGEKSKLSLADEYMNSFKRDEELLKLKGDKHDEIRILMKELYNNLDAMFNMNYTPIRPETEAKILFKHDAEVTEEGTFVMSAHEIQQTTKQKTYRAPAERTKQDRKRIKKVIGKQIDKKKPKRE